MSDKRAEGERILGEKAEVSYDRIDAFFDERSNNDSMKHKYNYVMYLDDTPEVAIERDRQCKEKVKGLLRIEPGMRVFDVGCGVGRWGGAFLQGRLSLRRSRRKRQDDRTCQRQPVGIS